MASIGDALELRRDRGGRWLAHADPDHQSSNGMFGGWTAALMLAAVTRTSDVAGGPSALTVNYLRAITPGDDVVVTAERLGGGRSINHWRAEVWSTLDEDLLATALVALTSRRPTEAHLQPPIPDLPDPATVERTYAPGTQGQQFDLRHIDGAFSSSDTQSREWVRDVSGRPVDHLQLAYFADAYAPRSFFWGVGPRPSATISMSVHFHATDDEIAAVGDDYMLIEAIGTRGEHSTSGQQARLWSRRGALLATTEQLCWYR
ncbi:MAG: thioesterase family protein [Mycobacteriales bacterium]